MTPNPYQSPQHAGYDAPQPGRLPLWVRVVRGTFTALAIAYAGWITIASVLAVVDYLRWQIGF
jgi:hypothetical protein